MKAAQNSRDLQAIISLVVFPTPTVTTLAFIKIACPCAFAFSSCSVWFKRAENSLSSEQGSMCAFWIIFYVNGFCFCSQEEWCWTLSELFCICHSFSTDFCFYIYIYSFMQNIWNKTAEFTVSTTVTMQCFWLDLPFAKWWINWNLLGYTCKL